MYMKEQQQKGSIVGSGPGDTHPFGDHRPANGGSNLMMEDERDPDVIPAQFGKEFCTLPWNNINQCIFVSSSQRHGLERVERVDGSVSAGEVCESREQTEQSAAETHGGDTAQTGASSQWGWHDDDGERGADDDDHDHVRIWSQSAAPSAALAATAADNDKDWPESVLPHGHISPDDNVRRRTGLGDDHDEPGGAERGREWRRLGH